MNIRSGLYGLHQNSSSNSTNLGKRSFSFGKYMSDTSTNTNLLGLAVTSMPATFSITLFWHCDSMYSVPEANRVTTRTAVASFNGYGWSQWTNGWDFTRGNGINQAGEVAGNGFNTLYLRDYAWAGVPIWVTYHVDILSTDWDKMNVNYV